MNRLFIRTALATAALCVAQASGAHEGDGKLGTVHFKVGCNAAAQREFDLAMAYYHSFAWEHIKAPLDRTLQADAACGMVHWARAPGLARQPLRLARQRVGEDAGRRRGADGAGAQDRARDRSASATMSMRSRSSSRMPTSSITAPAPRLSRTGSSKVAAKYPEDTEATILYSLVLSANFDPTDKQYSNQLRAAKLLEPIFAKQPEHPGAAHYLIHSYDYPPLAAQGLPAAQRYSKIAPAAAHAQHMPSHIFTRVGAWSDSVAANTASAKADTADGLQTLHAYDYMVYAHLQMGQDRAAQGGARRRHRACQAARQLRRRVCLCGDTGATGPRAQRLGRSGHSCH